MKLKRIAKGENQEEDVEEEAEVHAEDWKEEGAEGDTA